MIETTIAKSVFTATKYFVATHPTKVVTTGKVVLEKVGNVAIATAPLTVPGVVSGVAGGTIAHVAFDDPKDRTICGAVTGGVGGAVSGYITGGPVGAVTNGIIGAAVGGAIGNHEF